MSIQWPLSADEDSVWASGISPRHQALRERLGRHPLYGVIHDRRSLGVFMEHHVYAVWDFMSLIKSLQAHIAPVRVPWLPPENPRHVHFINQLVLEEESDHALTGAPGVTHASHFESYCRAMAEVGADTGPISRFIARVRNEGLESALQMTEVPGPSRRFMEFTFDVIGRNQAHLLASVLAYGREDLVPQLFRSLLDGLRIGRGDASHLYAYLERHVVLDEQAHGPMAVLMARELCGNSSEKQSEAMALTERALEVRLEFWDGVYQALSA